MFSVRRTRTFSGPVHQTRAVAEDLLFAETARTRSLPCSSPCPRTGDGRHRRRAYAVVRRGRRRGHQPTMYDRGHVRQLLAEDVLQSDEPDHVLRGSRVVLDHLVHQLAVVLLFPKVARASRLPEIRAGGGRVLIVAGPDRRRPCRSCSRPSAPSPRRACLPASTRAVTRFASGSPWSALGGAVAAEHRWEQIHRCADATVAYGGPCAADVAVSLVESSTCPIPRNSRRVGTCPNARRREKWPNGGGAKRDRRGSVRFCRKTQLFESTACPFPKCLRRQVFWKRWFVCCALDHEKRSRRAARWSNARAAPVVRARDGRIEPEIVLTPEWSRPWCRPRRRRMGRFWCVRSVTGSVESGRACLANSLSSTGDTRRRRPRHPGAGVRGRAGDAAGGCGRWAAASVSGRRGATRARSS